MWFLSETVVGLHRSMSSEQAAGTYHRVASKLGDANDGADCDDDFHGELHGC